MQSKPSQALPIIVGFGLCLSMVLAISIAAWHTSETNLIETNHVSDYEALVQVEQSLRHFNAARVAMLQFRETRDLAFDTQAKKRLDEAFKSADGIQHQFGIHENRVLMDLYKQFAALYHEDIKIGQELDRMSPGPDDELPNQRRAIREKQDDLAAEIEAVGDDLSNTLGEYLANFEDVTRMRLHQMRRLILITSTVAMLVGIASCFVVIRVINRPASRSVSPFQADEFSSPSPPNDLRTVADKLQEVVDLLRK